MHVFLPLVVIFAICLGAPGSSSAAGIGDELAGTFWTGTIQGRGFQGKLLNGNRLEYRTDKGASGDGKWEINNRQFEGFIAWPDGEGTLLRAEVSGARMTGTAEQIGGPKSQFTLDADPGLRAKWEILVPQVPGAPPGPFDGTYDAEFPEKVGQRAPFVKWMLSCRADLCRLSIADEPAEKFDRIDPLRESHIAEARRAVQYARERKAAATQERPELAPLLDSQAELESCVNLSKRAARSSEPGLLILCKLSRDPWKKPAVLLMGTILANCGPAFCRYSMFPMFRR